MNKILRCSLLTAAVCLTSASYAAENENPQWKTVSASDNTTYAIKADGTLWAARHCRRRDEMFVDPCSDR